MDIGALFSLLVFSFLGLGLGCVSSVVALFLHTALVSYIGADVNAALSGLGLGLGQRQWFGLGDERCTVHNARVFVRE